MHAARRRLLAYIALGASGAIFSGAAIAHLGRSPLIAVLLGAQVTVILSVIMLVLDGRRARQEVAVVRADVTALREDFTTLKASLRTELGHLDEHVEMIASRTERLANLLEVRKAIQPPGTDEDATGEILSFPAGVRRIR